ncbi:hypothetical protein BC835DRAFT_412113 [Cytidiella melzeri]|nr:hypothetical protein BC835DRAFT_412113 [Cytidiella melzeri]
MLPSLVGTELFPNNPPAHSQVLSPYGQPSRSQWDLFFVFPRFFFSSLTFLFPDVSTPASHLTKNRTKDDDRGTVHVYVESNGKSSKQSFSPFETGVEQHVARRLVPRHPEPLMSRARRRCPSLMRESSADEQLWQFEADGQRREYHAHAPKRGGGYWVISDLAEMREVPSSW